MVFKRTQNKSCDEYSVSAIALKNEVIAVDGICTWTGWRWL